MKLPQCKTGVRETSLSHSQRPFVSSALELQGATFAAQSSRASWTTAGQPHGLNSSSSKMQLIVLPTFTDHFEMSE